MNEIMKERAMRWKQWYVDHRKHVLLFVLVSHVVIFSFLLCSPESDEERMEREAAELRQMEIEDSLAFKVAVMPRLDCLPFFVARECGLVDTTAMDFRLKLYQAQMDCDTAMERGRAELAVGDIVGVEYMKSRGVKVDYLTATNAEWMLVANGSKGVDSLAQMTNKMIAMTRYSATDMLSEMAMDSAGLTADRTFKIQINDVRVRLNMLLNDEMDAAWFTEPQVVIAMQDSNRVMMTTREKGIRLGVIAMRSDLKKDETRARQLEQVANAYNQACDTINVRGLKHFKDVIAKYCNVSGAVVEALPSDIRFDHIAPPRKKDIDAAKEFFDN